MSALHERHQLLPVDTRESYRTTTAVRAATTLFMLRVTILLCKIAKFLAVSFSTIDIARWSVSMTSTISASNWPRQRTKVPTSLSCQRSRNGHRPQKRTLAHDRIRQSLFTIDCTSSPNGSAQCGPPNSRDISNEHFSRALHLRQYSPKFSDCP